jgi:hypothetical protein
VVVSPHVDPGELDVASGEARRVLLEHVAACRACRAAAAAYDPSLLFALLALAPVPAAVLDAVSQDVLRRIEPPSRRAPLRAVAAAAAVVALASGVSIFLPGFEPTPVTPLAAVVPRADVDVAPGGAVSQVVDFTVGDTQVVMVYNAELQL